MVVAKEKEGDPSNLSVFWTWGILIDNRWYPGTAREEDELQKVIDLTATGSIRVPQANAKSFVRFWSIVPWTAGLSRPFSKEEDY